MITDPTELFQALINCVDEESNRPNNLPKATPQAVASLLMDDDSGEDTQIRGMHRLAANTINDLLKQIPPATDYIDIVFDGPPGHESGQFVEVENAEGKSIDAGTWIVRADGLHVLRIAMKRP